MGANDHDGAPRPLQGTTVRDTLAHSNPPSFRVILTNFLAK